MSPKTKCTNDTAFSVTPALNGVSHYKAAKIGFLKSVEEDQTSSGIIYTMKSSYPGLLLKRDRNNVAAMVQIIPDDDYVVGGDVSHAKSGETAIDYKCFSKDHTTAIRFCLGNFTAKDMMFTVTAGSGDKLVHFVVPPQTYMKLAGTRDDKEIVLGDTDIPMRDVETRKVKIPIKATYFNVTFSSLDSDWGYIEPISSGGCFSAVRPNPPKSIVYFDCFERNTVPDCETDSVDSHDGPTACVVNVTDRNVAHTNFSTTTFNTQAEITTKIHFSKSVQIPEKVPVIPNNFPQLIICRNDSVFICPHESNQLKMNELIWTVENMKCACVDSDAKMYAVLKALVKMTAGRLGQ